jgi:DNA-binding response OmpR family regulator
MTKPSVLLIDDSSLILAAARHALMTAGCEVTTALTLEELAAVPANNFDLILMDVEMPELYGDDIAAILRHERNVRVPIYLFSSVQHDQLAALARDAGIDGFISKQDGMDAMVDRVRGILGMTS